MHWCLPVTTLTLVLASYHVYSGVSQTCTDANVIVGLSTDGCETCTDADVIVGLGDWCQPHSGIR